MINQHNLFDDALKFWGHRPKIKSRCLNHGKFKLMTLKKSSRKMTSRHLSEFRAMMHKIFFKFSTNYNFSKSVDLSSLTCNFSCLENYASQLLKLSTNVKTNKVIVSYALISSSLVWLYKILNIVDTILFD